MKVGIITFHRVINYGGVLQAYALQQAIRKCADSDVSVEIIDYINPYFQQQYAPFSIKMLRHPKSLLTKVYLAKYKRVRNRKFASFVTKYMTLGSKKIKAKDLLVECEKYDKLITGSDQVWNPECTGGDFAYFLELNGTAEKYSYAASFAVEKLNPIFKDRIKECLSGYRRISVREEAGVEIVKNLLEKTVDIMPDPTLLINAQQWRILETKLESLPEKYNLIIQMGGKIEDLQMHAKKLSEDAPVVYVNLAQRPVEGLINICTASPEEWLYIIDHADNIITNSFHGCIFSILFHKSFYYELTKGKNSNSRLITLAKNLGFEERNVKLLYMNKEVKEIDYSEIEKRLHSLRLVAEQYIREIVGEKI